MSITRVHQPVPLHVSQTMTLDERASHHLARVLRAEVGDALVLFNGEGGEYHADITQINKKSVTVMVKKWVDRDAESPLKIMLAQGIARGEKMDFILQKAVELGVAKIVPLITERCNVRISDEREEKKLERWRSVIISACEQCGRNKVPEISVPMTLTAWLLEVKADKCFVLSPHVASTLGNEKISANATIAVLIGPEGGLSEKEIEMATAKHFQPLVIGPRILRTETATLAAITVLQAIYGDMK